jgi:hypothetical protein
VSLELASVGNRFLLLDLAIWDLAFPLTGHIAFPDLRAFVESNPQTVEIVQIARLASSSRSVWLASGIPLPVVQGLIACIYLLVPGSSRSAPS